MTEYSWAAVRAQATKAFNGETLNAETEAAIIEVFELLPQTVVRAIEQVGADYAKGGIRSGWAVLRKVLVAAEPRRDITVSDASERESQAKLAESWIRRTGCQVDRESELVLELFGDRGRLRHWAQADSPRDDRGRDLDGWELVGGDGALVDRMVAVWRVERPRGERCEAASVAWDERLREQRRAMAGEPRVEHTEPPTVELTKAEAAEIEARRVALLAALVPA